MRIKTLLISSLLSLAVPAISWAADAPPAQPTVGTTLAGNNMYEIVDDIEAQGAKLEESIGQARKALASLEDQLHWFYHQASESHVRAIHVTKSLPPKYAALPFRNLARLARQEKSYQEMKRLSKVTYGNACKQRAIDLKKLVDVIQNEYLGQAPTQEMLSQAHITKTIVGSLLEQVKKAESETQVASKDVGELDGKIKKLEDKIREYEGKAAEYDPAGRSRSGGRARRGK